MDELDVKIIRALVSERAVAPSSAQVSSSLRSLASRIGKDDATLRYRYKRIERSGFLSGWQLLVNPTLFGYKMFDVTVDVQPESGKEDMIRKLKLIHEITAIHDFYGRAMKIAVMYGGEDSRSRTIELISRITNSETMTQIQWALPGRRTEHLTETDVAIIRALTNNARRSFVQVARELGLSPMTVRNHIGKLRSENAIFAVPVFNVGSIPGLVPVFLSFSYANNETKGRVDRSILSHFADKYFSVELADLRGGSISLSGSTVTEAREYLEWTKSLPGVASARADILVKSIMFPEKRIELLELSRKSNSIALDGSSIPKHVLSQASKLLKKSTARATREIA